MNKLLESRETEIGLGALGIAGPTCLLSHPTSFPSMMLGWRMVGGLCFDKAGPQSSEILAMPLSPISSSGLGYLWPALKDRTP